ncbi:hypothetical protein E2I00_005503, partial [Balaenoptera physalus]
DKDQIDIVKKKAFALEGEIVMNQSVNKLIKIVFTLVVTESYWGNKIGKPHTVPCKVAGRCGSVLVRLIPAPRGTGIVSAPVPKKLLVMAGIDDCYTSARGSTATLGNFAKATFDTISKTFSYLTPDLWKETLVELKFEASLGKELITSKTKHYGFSTASFSTLSKIFGHTIKTGGKQHMALLTGAKSKLTNPGGEETYHCEFKFAQGHRITHQKFVIANATKHSTIYLPIFCVINICENLKHLHDAYVQKKGLCKHKHQEATTHNYAHAATRTHFTGQEKFINYTLKNTAMCKEL